MLCYVILCYVMLCYVMTTVNSLHVRESKTLLDSKFHFLESGSPDTGFKIPIVSGIPDFLSCIPDSTNKQKFPGFWKLY